MTVENRSFREKLYHVIDNDEEQSWASQTFEFSITALILISIFTIVLESFSSIRAEYGWYFDTFESSTLIIFTVEYLLRLFTADFKFKDCKSLPHAAWRLFKSPSGIVDLLAISPIFFHFTRSFGWGGHDLRFVRVLKITRLLRVFKMNSFTNSITVIVDVFIEKKHDLGITMFVTAILLFVSATLMWYLEGSKQPEQFPNILATLWWAIATLTTVGYGDVYPITPWGKVMAGVIALLGIGLVALPAGILSSAFIEKLEDGTIKEEEVENYVPKGILPQAQFQKITSKAQKEQYFEAKRLAELATQQSKEAADKILTKLSLELSEIEEKPPAINTCKDNFGAAFVFCPYCGKKLDNHA